MESKRFGMSRRNFVKLSGATGILSVAGLAACGNSGSSSAGSSTTFKLGNIGPLTGAAAIYGNATKNGAQLAVDEINAAGGSIQFEHNCQDDEHDPEKSVNAYNNLKDWGLQVLVGPTTTNPCVAVSAETNSDNVFELTPSASSNDVIGGQEDADGNVTTARKDNVFQMCFTDPNQGTASAQYLAKKQLGTKIAVIYNNSDAYSAGVYKKFEAEAANQGLQIVSTSTFTDDNATDFSVQLNDAKNNGADLVFLPIYYTPAALILTQANGMGYAPDFFGCDGMDGILTVEGFDTKLAEGLMLLTPFVATATDEKTSAFTKAYKDAYGDEPIQFAADAYDCVYVVKELLEKTGCTPDMSASDICDKLKAAIVDGYTYSGLTGENMSWKDTGEVSKEPKGMVIKDGVYQPLD
ncbi:branched-chain amino acid ABC transporter substrate-binding protein [Parolsenella catena]|uniref:Branched-chain amino acid ABC transporter substrate-binding protein n=1 Tax=Parolsenella catena TaxID=2003188 RepID=A0A3G9JWR0_9ACTN|nr:ABC transporter substrate-binding protein [Parolsenella catena]BBH49803.1 branched-chain amino acid ABC transporter substrate-binding protein [Parolsenella catena]